MPQSTLFSGVRVYDRGGAFDGETVDLLVDGGRIRVNPDTVPQECERVDIEGLCVSPGWVDIGAAFGEPGHEERETIATLLAAAQTGGYTRVVGFADTLPALDAQNAVRATLDRAGESNDAKLHLIGCLSQGRGGKQLAEIGEMAAAGVRLFGDGLRAVEDPELLQLALAYTQPFGATVVVQPGEPRLDGAGQMHEGEMSTMLGLPGLPAISESIGLQRELHLLRYRGGQLHLFALTLASSLEAAASAKTQSGGLTYGIAALHLLFDDSALLDYDVNLKVRPPLRSRSDREALVEAIRSGAADALVSNHRPLDVESKRVEFPYAGFGASTIETAFALALTAVEDVEVVVDYLARRNRGLAQLPKVTIEEGAEAELSFFLPERRFVAPPKSLASLGINPPAVGNSLRGLPAGTYLDGIWRPSRWLTSNT